MIAGMSHPSRRLAWVLVLLAAFPACRGRESPEATRDRAAEAFLVAQIADLRRLIARAESGDFASGDRIVISVSEAIVKRVIDASLPREATLGGRVRVRITSAQPFFRGNNAALVFQALARGIEAGAPEARLEIGGTLERMRISRGTLVADVELTQFTVLDTSLGSMAAEALETLVGENQRAVTGLLPAIEIPVHLEQAVEIGGLHEGVVVARGGVLPLEMTVAEVVPVGERLWVLLDAKAGPWQPAAAGQ
jgi:hypothetical protein